MTMETLSCVKCNYHSRTSKFLQSSGELSITCPKCKTVGTLGEWRGVQVVPVKPSSDKEVKVGISSFALFGAKFVAGAIFAVLFLGFAFASLVAFADTIDSGWPKEDRLTLINANLNFFKFSAIAFGCFYLSKRFFRMVAASGQTVHQKNSSDFL
jgi:Zn ribbon nucleic-acid-binding protein